MIGLARRGGEYRIFLIFAAESFFMGGFGLRLVERSRVPRTCRGESQQVSIAVLSATACRTPLFTVDNARAREYKRQQQIGQTVTPRATGSILGLQIPGPICP